MLLDHLSNTLVLNKDFILIVAESASRRYKRFEIDKSGGGKRVIFHPAKELKVLQRVIHDDILTRLPIHPAATAYCTDSSTKRNADVHKGKHYLLRLDFKTFFESITADDIRNFLNLSKNHISPAWGDEDTNLFIKLVCFNNRLTIGAVTSPMLSNTICYALDSSISGICEAQGICYSRYADDLFFSTDEADKLLSFPKQIKTIIRTLECPKSLWINYDKTRHSSKKRRMLITGLVLTNSGTVSIGRGKKREIRALVYKWDTLDPNEKKYLKGYLSYCRSVEPEFINTLCEKYGAKAIREIQQYITP